jgi:hypothetical protein
MSKRKRDHPTQDDVNQLSAMLREMEENSRRSFGEATEFKPGELTPEEEEFIKRKGLSALNYIPQKTLQKQSEAFQKYEEKMRKRAEVMSRPKTNPERVQMEREECAQAFRKGLADRFDGAGYGVFLFVIAAFTWLIIDTHGWPMGIFCCLLMLAILELGYRLYARH